MERSMWQDIRDCDYSYMVNGLCSVDVTLILLIKFLQFFTHGSLKLFTKQHRSQDHTGSDRLQ